MQGGPAPGAPRQSNASKINRTDRIEKKISKTNIIMYICFVCKCVMPSLYFYIVLLNFAIACISYYHIHISLVYW